VVGDLLYGDKAAQKQYARLMLHARRLELRLLSGEELKIEAPVSESFEAVLRSVQGGRPRGVVSLESPKLEAIGRQ
jgi:hypothetical protein